MCLFFYSVHFITVQVNVIVNYSLQAIKYNDNPKSSFKVYMEILLRNWM